VSEEHRIWVEAGKGRVAWKRRGRCRCGWHGQWYPARDHADAMQDAREHRLTKRLRGAGA
jgi:hypothetical protein